MLKYITHKFKSLKVLLMPYKYSFIVGHSHLTNSQVAQIDKVLETSEPQSVRDDYENRFSVFIGSGRCISFAAGRMAFYVLLKALAIGKGDEVILPGFTCSVMVTAVLRTGATPIFADIDAKTFGSSAEGIENKLTSRTKLIVAQHSFGIPCKIDEIVELGKRKGIFIVEDCALSLGSSYKGVNVGDWGDAAIFSTEHSKPLNTLIGGLLYTKDKALYKKIYESSVSLPELDRDHQFRLYSEFLFERKYYMPKKYQRTFFMNIYRAILKKLRRGNEKVIYLDGDFSENIFGSRSYSYPTKLPLFLAQIGLFELDRWQNERDQRRALLKQYLYIMQNSKMAPFVPEIYNSNDLDIVPFRFVFTHPEAARIKKMMMKYININQTLFNEPIVCCPDGPESLGYLWGSCQSSERVCSEIVNWPCILPERFHRDMLDIFMQIVNY